jgi:Fibronectin type III domain
VRVDDSGTALTLTWTDPSGGTAPFIVAGAKKGEQPTAMAQITPGGTRYVLNGLNPKLDYCFIVVAVYSTEDLVQSDKVCTQR